MDPELRRSLVDLGMPRDVKVQDGQVKFTLALTVPACPLNDQIIAEARSAVLARGMGAGAYESMKQAGINPIVTDIAGIDEAVSAYLAGQITDHTERLH